MERVNSGNIQILPRPSEPLYGESLLRGAYGAWSTMQGAVASAAEALGVPVPRDAEKLWEQLGLSAPVEGEADSATVVGD